MKCVAVGDMFLSEEAFARVFETSGTVLFLSGLFMEGGSGSCIYTY
ncbi:MAG: hypothetical protein ACLTJG_05770 [[Clostridium] innocuum]